MISGVNIFNPPIGTLRIGSVADTNNYDKGKINVQLANVLPNEPKIVSIRVPQNLALNNGLFVGAKPSVGTPVVLGIDSANQYHFISYQIENTAFLPKLNQNEILLSANNRTKITLNSDRNDIYIGSDTNKLHINSNVSLFTSRFDDEHHFTQASRRFDGIIKREKKKSTELTGKGDLNTRLTNDNYDPNYEIISFDPSVAENSVLAGNNKNPPFVESREIVYEFQYSSGVRDDIYESSLYKPSNNQVSYSLTNRRQSKADTLSLTLASPNYLIETVKGTVVDIFGNILDLNRFPLPIGKDQNTLHPDNSTDKYKSFLKIKELERRSVAYHFEINARKDFSTKIDSASNFADLFGFDAKFPDADYGRLRSRFFIDIDKEGQFKLNVPASSEKGNIPLLTRYENYSTLSPEDNNNPDKLIYRNDSLDILHDSFACPTVDKGEGSTAGNYGETPGSITIKENDAVIPLQDRRYEGYHLKHGTAYHDILYTCYAHQTNKFLENYIADTDLIPELIGKIKPLKDIVKDTITIGENAGGRSGSINFDGSIEMNVGANTSDRQSLWLDTAGGIVANIGRDVNSRSAVMSMNGDVFLEIGGRGVVGDKRFKTQQNGQIGAVLDIRVFDNGLNVTMIRIDDSGLTIMTPGDLKIHSRGEMKFSAKGVEIDADHCKILGREVKKQFGGSI